MTELFRINTIKPKELFSSKRVRAMVLNAMKREGREMARDLNSTTEYWEHKAIFEPEIRYRGGNVILAIGIRGSQLAVKYWNFVDKGTPYRYVIFHKEYSPKTTYPGRFYSNIAGNRTKRNEKIVGRSNRRLHGIHARGWAEKTMANYSEVFPYVIDEAIARGLEPK